MVDITQCAVCGRTIPATLDGCAYCDSERPAMPPRDDYVPMHTRWLLVLFVLTTLLTAGLAAASLAGVSASASGPLRAVLAASRLALSVAAGYGVARRRPWAWRAAQLFVALEILAGGAHAFGLLPGDVWSLRVITPLWAILFGIFFLRSDVQAHFDRPRGDRAQVEALIHSMDSPRGGRDSQDPKRR